MHFRSAVCLARQCLTGTEVGSALATCESAISLRYVSGHYLGARLKFSFWQICSVVAFSGVSHSNGSRSIPSQYLRMDLPCQRLALPPPHFVQHPLQRRSVPFLISARARQCVHASEPGRRGTSCADGGPRPSQIGGDVCCPGGPRSYGFPGGSDSCLDSWIA